MCSCMHCCLGGMARVERWFDACLVCYWHFAVVGDIRAFDHCPVVTFFPPCHCSILVMLVRLTSYCHGLLPHSVPLCLCHAAFPLSCHLLSLGYFVLPGILYRHGHARTMFSLVRTACLLSVAWSITGAGTIFVIRVRFFQVLACLHCMAMFCWPSSPWILYYHGVCAIACVPCVVSLGSACTMLL